MSLICIDARYLRERPSGIGAMVDAVVRQVPALLPEHEFLLLRHPKAASPLSTSPNVRELTVTAEANGPGTLFVLPRLVPLAGVDLFHATFNILPAGLTMRTITTVHDVMWLTHPELCRAAGTWGHVEKWFYGNGLRRALAKSTRLFAVSEATRIAIAAVDARAGSRTDVIRHGIDPAFHPADDSSPALAAARVRYAPGARRYVLTVGQHAGYKNHRRVVQAFLGAFRDDPSTHLVLVQRLGREARELLDLARAENADGRVHVLPSVPFDDLVALYQGALCLCHPSLMEGWGMPVSEAMGCGCPVVTADRSSMPEVAGGSALLVDPESVPSIAEALRAMGEDEGARQAMRLRGLARARELSWAQHAKETAEGYLRVLG